MLRPVEHHKSELGVLGTKEDNVNISRCTFFHLAIFVNIMDTLCSNSSNMVFTCILNGEAIVVHTGNILWYQPMYGRCALLVIHVDSHC